MATTSRCPTTLTVGRPAGASRQGPARTQTLARSGTPLSRQHTFKAGCSALAKLQGAAGSARQQRLARLAVRASGDNGSVKVEDPPAKEAEAEVPVPEASGPTDKPAPAAPATPAPAAAAPVIKDDYKEAARKEFRTVFDHPQWGNHRSTRRYARHMRFLFNSRIAKGLQTPLLFVTGVAATVCGYFSAVEAGLLPDIEPLFKIHSAMPATLTSFALSLLLVFRTNSSYGRWDEARKMWGSLVNRSRDLNRLGLSWISEERQDLRNLLRRWTVAYVYALMCHLRSDDDPKVELAKVLTPRELEATLSSTHRPNYCLQVLSQIIKEARIENPGAVMRMDENLAVFEDASGGMERIFRTPLPISYTRHTSRFMMIWLTLLPFSLWDSCHWTTVPITSTVAFLLLAIEEIGVSIEEPFSILPLEVICATIEKNVNELHSMHNGSGGAKQVLREAREGMNIELAASSGSVAQQLVHQIRASVPVARPVASPTAMVMRQFLQRYRTNPNAVRPVMAVAQAEEPHEVPQPEEVVVEAIKRFTIPHALSRRQLLQRYRLSMQEAPQYAAAV